MALKTTQLCVCELDNAAHKPFPPIANGPEKDVKDLRSFQRPAFPA